MSDATPDAKPAEPTSEISESEGESAETIPDGSGTTSVTPDDDADDDTASGGPAK